MTLIIDDFRRNGVIAGFETAFRVARNIIWGDARLLFLMGRNDLATCGKPAPRLRVVRFDRETGINANLQQMIERHRRHLWWDIDGLLKSGHVFYAGYAEEEMCCFAAIRSGPDVERYFFPMGEDWMLISHCVTLPGARGKGFYPELLQHVIHLNSEWCGTVVIDASDWNRSSAKPIERVGFHRVGLGMHRHGGKILFVSDRRSCDA